MVSAIDKKALWIGILALVAIISVTMLTGYGDGHLALKKQSEIAQKAKSYNDSQVDVIYERTMGGKQDWLHLEVDTTYHKVGKGNFTYKTLCNREFTLRAYDSQYEDWGNAYKHCFIESEGEKEWNLAPKEPIKLLGYEVLGATMTSQDNGWRVWYTEELPHIEDGATSKDSYKGLILEAMDSRGEYHLKAKYIKLNIG